MGPDYMSLRRGDSVRDIGEVEEGWAFGEVIDARGNFIQKGWYPPDYVYAQFFQVATEDWDSSSHGDDYMSLKKGEEFWHNGQVEDGWAFGERRDHEGTMVKSGWYPPGFAAAAHCIRMDLPCSRLRPHYEEIFRRPSGTHAGAACCTLLTSLCFSVLAWLQCLRRLQMQKPGRGKDKRTDTERGRKRKNRKIARCHVCRNFAHYGWAHGFYKKQALEKGCTKPGISCARSQT